MLQEKFQENCARVLQGGLPRMQLGFDHNEL
jgi:hypothetical protein